MACLRIWVRSAVGWQVYKLLSVSGGLVEVVTCCISSVWLVNNTFFVGSFRCLRPGWFLGKRNSIWLLNVTILVSNILLYG